MKFSIANSSAGRWFVFVLALVGMSLLFIPFVGMLPAVVKKVWLFPFFVSAVFGFLALKVSRQWVLSPEWISLTLAVLAAAGLQAGLAWDGHRQFEALRRKQVSENALSAGMYEQIAKQQGTEKIDDPTKVRWDVFLAQKYAALKLPIGWVIPWWVFEMGSTATLGVLVARTLLPSQKTALRETVSRETMT